MKTFLFSAFVGAAVITAPLQIMAADDDTTSGQTTPSTGSSTGTATGGQGERGERMKEALAQLDLSDAQKDQIKQIRATVTDRKERRQQIMAVLTPDQKAKLIQMFQQFRSEHQGSGDTSTTPSAN